MYIDKKQIMENLIGHIKKIECVQIAVNSKWGFEYDSDMI